MMPWGCLANRTEWKALTLVFPLKWDAGSPFCQAGLSGGENLSIFANRNSQKLLHVQIAAGPSLFLLSSWANWSAQVGATMVGVAELHWRPNVGCLIYKWNWIPCLTFDVVKVQHRSCTTTSTYIPKLIREQWNWNPVWRLTLSYLNWFGNVGFGFLPNKIGHVDIIQGHERESSNLINAIRTAIRKPHTSSRRKLRILQEFDPIRENWDGFWCE